MRNDIEYKYIYASAHLQDKSEASLRGFSRYRFSHSYCSLDGLASIKLFVQMDEQESQDCCCADGDERGHAIDTHCHDKAGTGGIGIPFLLN